MQPATLLRHLRQLVEPRGSTLSDRELLRCFTERRDEDAFEAVVKRHGPMVLRLCRRLLQRDHDAEDVFQATFLVLTRKVASLRLQPSVGPWLYEVAHRLCLEARVRASRRRVLESHVEDRKPADPLDDLRLSEAQALLEEELSRLAAKWRAPLVLCCLEGATRDEAAQQLGWSLGTLKRRLEQGRRRLKERLVRRGLTLSAALSVTLLSESTASALPALLAASTTRAALQFAAGQAVEGALSGTAGSLAEGALRTLLATKVKLGFGLVLALGVLAAGASLAARQSLEAPSPDDPPASASNSPQPEVKPQARLDDFGDPLPQGAIRRLGTTRFRHPGEGVNGLLLCQDGKTLVSNNYYGDRTVRAWELASGKLLHEFPGNYDCDTFIAVSPDGKTIAIPQGQKVVLWDLATGKEVARLEGEQVDRVNSVVFTPDGKTLVGGDQNGTLHFWDLATGTLTVQFQTIPGLRLSALAISPDGKSMALGDQLQNTLQLWDISSRRMRHDWTRKNMFHQIAFSPDGALLATGAMDDTIPLFDVNTGKLVRELRGWKGTGAVAFSPDGKRLAAVQFEDEPFRRSLGIWDVTTGINLCRWEGPRWSARSIIFSADGKTLIAGTGSTIRLWEAATGEERSPVRGNQWAGEVTAAPDGRTVAYLNGKDIRLLDAASGKETGVIPGKDEDFHRCLAFSPDGQTLASGFFEVPTKENVIELWDVRTRKPIGRLRQETTKPARAIDTLAFGPDGKILATGVDDGDVRLWDVTAGKELSRFSVRGEGHGHDVFFTVEAVAISPDGNWLAISGRAPDEGSRVQIREVATGKELSSLTEFINAQEDQPHSFDAFERRCVEPRIVFSPDGRMLAKNSRLKTVSVWEASTGKERCRLEGHQEATVCVAFSPDSRTLASSGWDNTVRLWDLDTGKELTRLKGHLGKANSLAFSVDGKTLVTAGDDTTLLFWDVASFTHRARPISAGLSPEELQTLWTDLDGLDASKAYRAITALSADPEQAVTLLRKHLEPIRAPDDKRLARSMGDLDSDDFSARERASSELEKLGEAAEPALRQALQGQPTAEVQRRVEHLLEQLGPKFRTQLRALEVLEHSDTVEARQLLEELANGVQDARLTREAKASLVRLGRDSGKP
jgi:RNA polymerase sigma factor (sigma-70 family)